MVEIILSNWLIISSVIFILLILIKFARGNKKDYKDLMKEGAIIVDVRTEDEYKAGHIQNSINVPLKDLTYRISEFDKKDNIVTVCAVGIRACLLYTSPSPRD